MSSLTTPHSHPGKWVFAPVIGVVLFAMSCQASARLTEDQACEAVRKHSPGASVELAVFFDNERCFQVLYKDAAGKPGILWVSEHGDILGGMDIPQAEDGKTHPFLVK